MIPKIIVIGGTFGVGKTTLAHNLACQLKIYNRVGLGTIAKTLKYIDPENPVVKNWSNYDEYKNKETLIKKLHQEASLVGKILKNIIDKAIYSGESYIIDGVQLLPQYLPIEQIIYLTLRLDNKIQHNARFLTPNLTKHRHLNNSNFDVAILYQEEICSCAKKFGRPIFDSSVSEYELTSVIAKDLNLQS